MVLYSIVGIFCYAHIQSMHSCALSKLSQHLESTQSQKGATKNPLFLVRTEINIGLLSALTLKIQKGPDFNIKQKRLLFLVSIVELQ
jgi:hypothetical protein